MRRDQDLPSPMALTVLGLSETKAPLPPPPVLPPPAAPPHSSPLSFRQSWFTWDLHSLGLLCLNQACRCYEPMCPWGQRDTGEQLGSLIATSSKPCSLFSGLAAALGLILDLGFLSLLCSLEEFISKTVHILFGFLPPWGWFSFSFYWLIKI